MRRPELGRNRGSQLGLPGLGRAAHLLRYALSMAEPGGRCCLAGQELGGGVLEGSWCPLSAKGRPKWPSSRMQGS